MAATLFTPTTEQGQASSTFQRLLVTFSFSCWLLNDPVSVKAVQLRLQTGELNGEIGAVRIDKGNRSTQ
jgi:hypothetical protein